MKNPFDPFGVFSVLRDQTPEHAPSESEKITDETIDESWGELVSVVQTGVERGMKHERKTCVDLIKKHLNTSDEKVKSLIQAIQSRSDD